MWFRAVYWLWRWLFWWYWNILQLSYRKSQFKYTQRTVWVLVSTEVEWHHSSPGSVADSRADHGKNPYRISLVSAWWPITMIHRWNRDDGQNQQYRKSTQPSWCSVKLDLVLPRSISLNGGMSCRELLRRQTSISTGLDLILWLHSLGLPPTAISTCCI